MPGQGLQFLPLSRIPEKWDPVWFAQFCREVLALADTRNAVEGAGITITGQPGEPATISSSEDITNLLLQTFVLATPSGFLNFERLLAGEANVVDIVDGGANGDITVKIRNNGLTLGKLRQLSAYGILGNPVNGIGAVQNITPEVDKAVVHLNGTAIEFDIIDHSYVSDFNEAAQDAVGTILTDSTSIDFTYNDGANTITATIIDEYVQDLIGAFLVDSSSIDFNYSDVGNTLTATTINANPSGLIGMAAVNGTAPTPLRSDGRHAIDPAIAPEWTGTHGWADNAEIQLGAGNDLRMYHDGTNSWVRNDTGILKLSAGTTVGLEIAASGALSSAQAAAWGGQHRYTKNFTTNGLGADSAIVMEAAQVGWAFIVTGSPANGKVWTRSYGATDQFDYVSSDDGNTLGIYMQVTRSGAAATNIAFGNTTDNTACQFQGTGRVTFGGVARLKGYTVATLPAGTVGDTAYVTDALAPTFLAVLVGGGAITTTAMYNGTNWVAQ